MLKVNALWYSKGCTNCIIKQCHTETMHILNPKPKRECENYLDSVTEGAYPPFLTISQDKAHMLLKFLDLVKGNRWRIINMGHECCVLV